MFKKRKRKQEEAKYVDNADGFIYILYFPRLDKMK